MLILDTFYRAWLADSATVILPKTDVCTWRGGCTDVLGIGASKSRRRRHLSDDANTGVADGGRGEFWRFLPVFYPSTRGSLILRMTKKKRKLDPRTDIYDPRFDRDYYEVALPLESVSHN
jgi:hypothetical protein